MIPTAPFWRRALAAGIDTAIGVAAWGLAGLWLVLGVRMLHPGPPDGTAVAVQAAALVLLALALHAVYHVGFVGGCGQTPGRMALGIAVTRRDGALPGLGRAAVRVLGGACAVLTLGLLSLVALLFRGSWGFSDWLAGTRVRRVPPGWRGGA